MEVLVSCNSRRSIDGCIHFGLAFLWNTSQWAGVCGCGCGLQKCRRACLCTNSFGSRWQFKQFYPANRCVKIHCNRLEMEHGSSWPDGPHLSDVAASIQDRMRTPSRPQMGVVGSKTPKRTTSRTWFDVDRQKNVQVVPASMKPAQFKELCNCHLCWSYLKTQIRHIAIVHCLALSPASVPLEWRFAVHCFVFFALTRDPFHHMQRMPCYLPLVLQTVKKRRGNVGPEELDYVSQGLGC
jgi:hypothetical protein